MNGIRRANEGDIPELLRLLVQVDMVHHEGRPDLFKGPATKYTAEELRILLKDEKRPVFACPGEDGKILGYAFCAVKRYENDHVMTDVKTLYIDDLCVDEAARGQGVGRALYEYALDFARRIGCYNLTLNVWACNPRAMRFYKKCGLVPQKIGMEKIL
ncbi:MAG: GNAT family N-acetyltransferase [Clostridia bacterium]|nr:GNAT family N-acetyltransferase [Clostridia bacterium]